MSVVIRGFDKPKNCYSCRFNDNNCWCSITKGTIDRDDYTCNVSCPIKQLPKEESKEMTSEEAIEFGNFWLQINEDSKNSNTYAFFKTAIQALEPKSEWEHDHEILKAYSDGANDILDKIRAEIIENSIEDYKYHGCGTDELIIETSEVLQIIDKYKEESEDKA